MAETISDRIRSVRGSLSQEQFATRLGVHKNTVGNYERGDREPDAAFCRAIREEFGVSIDWLLTGFGAQAVAIMRRNLAETEGGPDAAAIIEAGNRAAHDITPRVALDEELNARVVDGIAKLYKEERVGLAPMDLGRLAARLYADLVNACDDPNDRPAALKFALEQLRRQLRAAPGEQSETKRLA